MRRHTVLAAFVAASAACGSPAPTTAAPDDGEGEGERAVVVDPHGSDAVDVDAGRALFEHAWAKNDPRARRGGDGLGPLYNASSCVACHAQGGAGGSGGNHDNVVIGDGRVMHRHGSGPVPPAAAPSAFGLGTINFAGGGGLAGLLGIGRSVDTATSTTNVFVGAPEVTGSLDKELVHRVLQRARPRLNLCYERELARTPTLRGKVVLQFAVDTSGKVSSATVTQTGLANASVEACLTRTVKGLRFPKASSIAIVRYPLTFTRSDPAPPPPPPLPTVRVERNTPALFGAGLIDALADDVIEANAAKSIAGHPEITGKVGHSPEGRVTRFGWKGDVPDLLTFVSRACSVEIGLEVPGSPQPGPRPPGYDIDVDDLEDLVAYVRQLPRPREERDAVASEGAELFDQIGCTGCHTQALGDVDGLYSDLLLHDMGAQLDDNANVGYYGTPPVGGSNEWRTPPLWGVRDSAPYLHDGRARTLEAAIAQHGGEARMVRAAYRALSDEERGEVVAFLESLRAPASVVAAP